MNYDVKGDDNVLSNDRLMLLADMNEVNLNLIMRGFLLWMIQEENGDRLSTAFHGFVRCWFAGLFYHYRDFTWSDVAESAGFSFSA